MVLVLKGVWAGQGLPATSHEKKRAFKARGLCLDLACWRCRSLSSRAWDGQLGRLVHLRHNRATRPETARAPVAHLDRVLTLRIDAAGV